MKKLLLIILSVSPLFGRTEDPQELVSFLKKKVKYAEDFARLNPDPTISHNSDIQRIKQQQQTLKSQQQNKDWQYSQSKQNLQRQQPLLVNANEEALIASQNQKIQQLQKQHEQQLNTLKQQNAQALTTYKQQYGALQKLEEDHTKQLEQSAKDQESLQKKLEDLDKEFAEKKRLFDTAQEAVKKAKEEYNEALKTYHITAPKL